MSAVFFDGKTDVGKRELIPVPPGFDEPKAGSAWQRGPRRWFAPKKDYWCARRCKPSIPLVRRLPEGGAGGRAECHPACMTRDNFAARNSLLIGPDAPTPARIGTCRPMGRSHFSFGGERKVCKRKPAARRLREKALYCPFLKEGVRNVARSTVGLPTFTFVRARAHSFPLSKRARLFPSAAYRRSASPQLAAGRLTPCRVVCFGVAGVFLQRKRPA